MYVTLYVHAGIAASDVICCANLGQHAEPGTVAEFKRAGRAATALVEVARRAQVSAGT